MGPNRKLKLRKIGKSFGVILPAGVRRALRVHAGDSLLLEPNPHGDGFLLTAKGTEFDAQMRVARSLMARYAATLRELGT